MGTLWVHDDVQGNKEPEIPAPCRTYRRLSHTASQPADRRNSLLGLFRQPGFNDTGCFRRFRDGIGAH